MIEKQDPNRGVVRRYSPDSIVKEEGKPVSYASVLAVLFHKDLVVIKRDDER